MDDPRTYWYDIEGKRMSDDESMVAKLLDENILFVGCSNYTDQDGKLCGKTLTLFVVCNDVFAWACSDSESITLDELPTLFEMYEKNPECGTIQWLCIKRNEQPQLPVIDWLKERNCWNEQLENLPKNKFDPFCQRDIVK